MSFTAPSLQKTYAIVSSFDPALSLPEDADERANTLRVARETGNWQPLIKAGESPTLFWLRPLPGSTRSWLAGYQSRRRLTGQETADIALRLALRKIDNFGAFEKVSLVYIDDQELADVAAIDAIYGVDPRDPKIGASIVSELGGIVLERLMEGLSPKS
jgi:hypothetical protein